MKTRRILVLAAVLAPVQCAAQDDPAPPSATVEQAAESITAADFAHRVGVIAHDSMAGRDTPSPGLDMTAEWVASEFRRLGLRGGAEDGGFVQHYPLRARVVDLDASSLTDGTETLRLGEDLLPARGLYVSRRETGPLVVVSGSASPGPSVSEADVRGKHVVIVASNPSGRVDRSAQQYVTAAQNAGALSVLLSNPLPDASWTTAARRAFRPSVTKGWGDDNRPAPVAASTFLYIRPAAVARLLEGRDVDLASLRQRSGEAIRVDPVAGPPVTLTLQVDDRQVTAPNVVGIIEGSDPELRSEHVVFSGHIDHVGMGAPDADGDSIFNGADDDASGTVAVIEVAEAMAALRTRPKRSMIFLLVSGEEKGLWGSEWYAENPTVPVDRLVANLNTDMVGRNWPDTIVVIGKEHSDLGQTLESVNVEHPELGITAIDDLWPEENFYSRSDHFNFARRGVPVLFFFNGTHDDYHGRDDEPDRIDAEKAARIARLVFYLGMEIGDADTRPEWNPESYRRIVSDRE